MKVALSTIGKFHTFDLARELYARAALAGVLTGYPRFKLKNEGVPPELIHSFSLLHGAYMAFPWKDRLPDKAMLQWEWLDAETFASYAAWKLPPCDVYVGLSGSALKAGKLAHKRGARYVCDRGSTHIRAQDQILTEEFGRWGFPSHPVDARVIAAEEAEYEEADLITVPSSFVYRTFLSQGVPAQKLRKLSYGVNLKRFEPAGAPAEGRFDVLFVGGMSLRKGLPYLAAAFQQVRHPAKSLTFVGSTSAPVIDLLKQRKLWPQEAQAIGHVPQTELKTLMSRSHVMVLPSVEEGLAMVLAQTMACGCPILATPNTGAEDIVTDGVEGFIVPARDVDALAEKMQFLADNPEARSAMGARALARMQGFGGWRQYGDEAMAIYSELAAAK
ncbi:glycosyltransferase family 4 protein [Methylocella silvestris]|uniref:glycosyltransferase family 4 protein n=1 Tax=Methylocella silvestris TaxID=199596 RepID=UPI0002DA3AA2|nr:glycosyltransferase family 4 protein [Methylocella silvestris]